MFLKLLKNKISNLTYSYYIICVIDTFIEGDLKVFLREFLV